MISYLFPDNPAECVELHTIRSEYEHPRNSPIIEPRYTTTTKKIFTCTKGHTTYEKYTYDIYNLHPQFIRITKRRTHALNLSQSASLSEVHVHGIHKSSRARKTQNFHKIGPKIFAHKHYTDTNTG